MINEVGITMGPSMLIAQTIIGSPYVDIDVPASQFAIRFTAGFVGGLVAMVLILARRRSRDALERLRDEKRRRQPLGSGGVDMAKDLMLAKIDEAQAGVPFYGLMNCPPPRD